MRIMATDTLSLLLTVTAPIVVAALVYILNERAKRREFEREKKYDQKRERYAELLSSIRSIHDVNVGFAVLAEVGKVAQRAEPEKKGELIELQEIISSATTLFIKELVSARISSLIPNGTSPKGYEESVVAMIQLERDYERAFTMLTLLNAPQQILTQARTLHEGSSPIDSFSLDRTDQFEQDLRRLEMLMREDLQKTLSA